MVLFKIYETNSKENTWKKINKHILLRVTHVAQERVSLVNLSFLGFLEMDQL